jgi:hypothetical protein
LPFDGVAALKEAKQLVKPGKDRAVLGARYMELIESLSDGYDVVLTTIDKVNGLKQKRLGYAYLLLKVAAISATLAGIMELTGR